MVAPWRPISVSARQRFRDIIASTLRRRAAVCTKTRATIEDLYKVEGKAELVHGELVCMSPMGWGPGRAGGKIYRRVGGCPRREEGGGEVSAHMWVSSSLSRPP